VALAWPAQRQFLEGSVSSQRDRTAEAKGLIERLKALAVEPFEEDGSLRFRGPRGALQPHKAEVDALRTEVMEVLRGTADFVESDVPLSLPSSGCSSFTASIYNIGRVTRVRVAIDIPVFRLALNVISTRPGFPDAHFGRRRHAMAANYAGIDNRTRFACQSTRGHTLHKRFRSRCCVSRSTSRAVGWRRSALCNLRPSIELAFLADGDLKASYSNSSRF
jgi:hypothetical protein